MRAHCVAGSLQEFTQTKVRQCQRGPTVSSIGRQAEAAPDSYVSSLLSQGTSKVAQKVGEEATEVVVAALSESDERVISEVADLWFHTLTLLAARGLDVSAVEAELRRRDR